MRLAPPAVSWSRLRGWPWRRIGIAALWVVFGLLLGLWAGLPIRPAVEVGIRRLGYVAPLRAEVREVRRGLLGVTLAGIQVTGEAELDLDRLTLTPKASWLWGTAGFGIAAVKGEGELRADLWQGEEGELRLVAEAFPLGASRLGRSLPLGMALDGQLGGEVRFSYPRSNPAAVSGTARLRIDEARLRLPGGFALGGKEVLELGKVRVAARAERGRLHLEPLAAEGPDLHLSLRGTVRLQRPLRRSLLDLRLKVRPKGQLSQTFATLAPLLRLRRDRDAWVRELRGPLMAVLR